MTAQSMLEWLRRRPFRPFRVRMTDGMAYAIPRRDMAFLTRDNILIGIDADDDGIADRVKICHLPSVEAVEPLNDPMVYP